MCRWNSLLMNIFFRYALLVLLLGAAPLFAQSPSQVKTVELKQVGPEAVSEPLIRANIRVKSGDNFSRLAVDDDVRNLYLTGYFYNIRIVEEQSPEGYVLTYVLVGKPKVSDIKFTGNTQWDTSKLQKLLKSKVGEPLDERKLFADAQEIKKKYVNAGYQNTEVKYIPSIDENAGRGTVVFEVKEAPKVRIVAVKFDGAKLFPAHVGLWEKLFHPSRKGLDKEVKTRRWWMWSWITQSGKLKEEELEADKEKLAEFYREKGFIDFNLKDVRQELVRSNRMVLHFELNEGRQYRVGAITFKGVALMSTNDLTKMLKMKVGDIFTPNTLLTDVEALEDFYGTKGYIGSRPGSRSVDVFARKMPNIEKGTMDLVYEINEGEKSYIEKIEIKGNVTTKDKVIRRELAVTPGEVFDMVRVKRSKGRLQQMGYFERIEARPEDTDVPNRKNLVVGVEEKDTGSFTVGGGYGSVDSLFGEVKFLQGNFDIFKWPRFTGAGQKLRLYARFGTVLQDYEISFDEPWFLERKLSLGVDLYYRERGYYSQLYDERRYGARFSLTRALGSDFLIGTMGYTIENVGLYNVNPFGPSTIVNTEGDFLLNRLSGSIAYDTRNNGLLPDSGQRSELFGEVVAGDANFYKLEVKTAWYFPGLGEGHVLEIGVRAGVLDSFGSFGQDAGPYTYYTTTNQITGTTQLNRIENLPHNDVPFFERYYLGGAYSLRGFKFRDVSPQESGRYTVGREPVGGNTYYFAYAEYSLPIIDRLRIAAFYDIGNVYYNSYEMDFSQYNADVGLGIRLALPIGPLRFDYGIPVHDSNNLGGGGRFNFTVGYTREF